MTFAVELSELATADLIAIEDWLIERADPDTAASYVDRIVSRIAALDSFPNRGTPRDHLGKGVRSLSFERRIVILYEVEQDTVTILRVLDGARDLRDAIN